MLGVIKCWGFGVRPESQLKCFLVYVTMGKAFNLLEPRFSYLLSRDNNMHSLGYL